MLWNELKTAVNQMTEEQLSQDVVAWSEVGGSLAIATVEPATTLGEGELDEDLVEGQMLLIVKGEN